MDYKGIAIRSLEFIGPQERPVRLDFTAKLNLIYGASNTGKSFSLKVLDFMLGGSGPLPSIPERDDYDSILMGFEIAGKGLYTVLRSTSGGAYKLYTGLWEYSELPSESRIMQANQRSGGEQSFSGWLLEYLGLSGRQLAKNQSGEKENFNFRELMPYILVDETSIQSERSPVESALGPVTRPKERSVFRLLLTGADDKSITPVLDAKKFNAAKSTKIEVITSLLDDLNKILEADFPDTSDLEDQGKRLDDSLENVKRELKSYQSSSTELLRNRNALLKTINNSIERANEIRLHLQRFYQLNSIYDSDIERLESIEQASFLLSLEGADCTLCGAPAEAQTIKNPLNKIVQSQKTAIAEINKIRLLQTELESTISNLQIELHTINEQLPDSEENLAKIDSLLEEQRPKAGAHEASLNELLSKKYHVLRGLSLINQRDTYLKKISELESEKAPGKKDRPDLTLPGAATIKFCKVISSVLSAWGFPGEHIVSFDGDKYDIYIDGKLRIDNGKGVRAITHAAFKVALLIYCRQNELPHPGFIVFDSPLITYRDPLKNPKMGDLAPDELLLSKTSVKSKFFSHLESISHMGQFIILENIDPPEDIEHIANIETFYGSAGGGRYGLFPMLAVN
ncbi:hypothetical protein [Pseudomonas paraeruginosa]|uniref:hypothetical protein n=1 Tax=Pseudomonas paraeruginosa TaxID=2994495 RepID=UPI0039FD1FA7